MRLGLHRADLSNRSPRDWVLVLAFMHACGWSGRLRGGADVYALPGRPPSSGRNPAELPEDHRLSDPFHLNNMPTPLRMIVAVLCCTLGARLGSADAHLAQPNAGIARAQPSPILDDLRLPRALLIGDKLTPAKTRIPLR